MLRIIIILSIVLFCAPASGEIYKWIDAEGVEHYSTTPPPGAVIKSKPENTVKPAASRKKERDHYFQYSACYADVTVREHPFATSRKNGILPQGETVICSGSKEYWIKIVWKANEDEYLIGWVSKHAMCPVE